MYILKSKMYISRFGPAGATPGRAEGSISGGTPVKLQAKSTSGVEKIRQLWKIKYIDDGYYSIRSLYKSDRCIQVTSNTANLLEVSTSDTLSAIPAAARWRIEAISSGYIFQNCGNTTNKQCMRPSGTDVVTSMFVSGNSNFTWTLTADNSIGNQLILINSSTGLPTDDAERYISPGDRASLGTLGLVPSFISLATNQQDFYWYSGDPAVASVDSQIGTVTGIISGQCATISVRIKFNSVFYIKSYKVYVTSVRLVPQGMSNWCWVATAQMLAMNYAGAISVSQSSAVNSIFGSSGNIAGSPEKSEQAAEYFINNSSSTSVDIVHTSYGTILSKTAVIGCIDEGHVLIAFRGVYPGAQTLNQRNGGHAVLIYGYEYINGTYEFFVFDPNPIGSGTALTMTYEDLRNGAATTENDSYVHIWDAVIVADGWYFESGKISAYE